MDKLPQEIISNIASFLPWGSGRDTQHKPLIRPGVASLSRAWQAAVESVTFQELHINNTELVAFSDHFSRIHRRRFLRKLNFSVVLPTYSYKTYSGAETEEERRVNNEVASTAIFGLLQELSGWPTNLNITLIITIYPPKQRLRSTSYIHLEDIHHVQVPCIRSFLAIQAYCPIDPGCLVSLTSRFPSLSRVDWCYDEPDSHSPLRIQLRDELVASLSKFELSPATERLHFTIETPKIDYGQPHPNLIGCHLNDPLSTALNRLLCGGNLRYLLYQGPIDSSFFWSGEFAKPNPEWASLEYMDVRFHNDSPSGKQYFKRAAKGSGDKPSPTGSEDSPQRGGNLEEYNDIIRSRGLEEFGFKPEEDFPQIPEDVAPLLEAFARRLAITPSLRSALLSAKHPSGKWVVRYYAPGHPCSLEDDIDEPEASLSRTRLFFQFQGWEPEDSLMGLFRSIGRERHGENTIITFI
ncbi:hypothetical protein F4821DRAFT_251792 [Hypoxylon rubiginosum]|uniref:Uncharacterized protein n=1 Tax=Hypoxylon rubiginosum TaxID=110542 RepID=A0ACC0CIN0_9PEZI|nr:hypothetical protein F4821DRAFT_251792 [Hypoxylon rubiginosum]